MATIPQGERNAAIDALMRVVGEDAYEGGRLINYLNTAFPGFTWMSILRTRSANWAPYISSGLSITAWCNEVERQAAIFANQ